MGRYNSGCYGSSLLIASNFIIKEKSSVECEGMGAGARDLREEEMV